MLKQLHADVAIVGAGIVGLAHAYMALQKGLSVVLFERNEKAVGASVRNFGLVWPIGQEPGAGLSRALKGREHWRHLATKAGFWLNENGSLHLAYHDDEWDVLNEFSGLFGNNGGYQCSLLSRSMLRNKSEPIRHEKLKGGLWSATECTVNPREAIRKLPEWMIATYGLTTRFGHTVRSIEFPRVETSAESWTVEKVFVCSGADFETLYPVLYDERFTRCKLQMMKVSTSVPVSIGPTLCAGLTLRHYAAFRRCPSLKMLDARFDDDFIDYKKHGIHVLLAQNKDGELIVGDSHHYGRNPEPFDSEEVNQLILGYLQTFTTFERLQIVERWHGVYPKFESGIDFIVEPERGVVVVNGLGGAGMTLSFGLAEENSNIFL